MFEPLGYYLGVKAHFEGPKIVVTLYYFLGYPCLNCNHIIINKDFHNVLHIMVGQNTRKSNAKEVTFMYVI